MELRLERKQYKPGSTIGRLYVDGVFECFTLEDGIRTHKVYGETAIPAGRYAVVINYSPRFKTRLPLLRDVPRFEGVRIHPGNTPANTLGCILVGRNWKQGAEAVTASRIAFTPLQQKIEVALERGEPVLLHILQENAPPELAARAPRRRYKSTARAKAPAKRKTRRPAAKRARTTRVRAKTKRPSRKTARPARRRR